MGYEAEVPHVPTRKEEMDIIKAIKESFQRQPWNKYYMAESVRINKLDRHRRENIHNQAYIFNFAKGLLFGGLIALSFTPFFKRAASSVPMYNRPKMVLVGRGYNFNNIVKWRAMIYQVPFTLVFAFTYSACYTSSRPLLIGSSDRAKLQVPRL